MNMAHEIERIRSWSCSEDAVFPGQGVRWVRAGGFKDYRRGNWPWCVVQPTPGWIMLPLALVAIVW